MDHQQIPDGWEVPGRSTSPGDRQASRPPATGPHSGSHQSVSSESGPPVRSEADRIRHLFAEGSRARALISLIEHDAINRTRSLPVPLYLAMQTIMNAVYILAGEHPDVDTLRTARSDQTDG